MESKKSLKPVSELVKTNRAHFPNESPAYRKARNELLAAELELRRHLEQVAEMRRQLPLGGEVKKQYLFQSEKGPVTLTEMFGNHQTLILYNFMFGPQRERACPMCTSFMSTWDHKIQDILQRVAIGFIARSPIERLSAFKKERSWTQLPIFSDSTGDYTRDYVSPEDADVPGYTVFTKKNGVIHHFWSGEFNGEMADPGQDPRGAPDFDPLWNLLDTTPEGRGTDWYPSLNYPNKK